MEAPSLGSENRSFEKMYCGLETYHFREHWCCMLDFFFIWPFYMLYRPIPIIGLDNYRPITTDSNRQFDKKD